MYQRRESKQKHAPKGVALYTGAAGAGPLAGQTLASHCEADVKRQGRSQLQGTQDRTALRFVRERAPGAPGPRGSLPILSTEAHVHLINLAAMVLVRKTVKGGREGGTGKRQEIWEGLHGKPLTAVFIPGASVVSD